MYDKVGACQIKCIKCGAMFPASPEGMHLGICPKCYQQRLEQEDRYTCMVWEKVCEHVARSAKVKRK
jgi:predicted  nucleic acid-binding Zn-ribbon protein